MAGAIRRLTVLHSDGRRRCAWCGTDPLYMAYHDQEWGVPVYNERKLFEMLCLEGAQAGLSWITVLRKRDGYRAAFANFDPKILASWSQQRLNALLQDPGIVRNRLKIAAVRTNARAYLDLRAAGSSLDELLWQHAPPQRRNRPRGPSAIPATTPASDALSKTLKAHGFKFVGSTICYALMQAVGIVDDHQLGCWRA